MRDGGKPLSPLSELRDSARCRHTLAQCLVAATSRGPSPPLPLSPALGLQFNEASIPTRKGQKELRGHTRPAGKQGGRGGGILRGETAANTNLRLVGGTSLSSVRSGGAVDCMITNATLCPRALLSHFW